MPINNLEFQANFVNKESIFNTTDCIVSKVVELSGSQYDFFRRNMLRDFDFIKDNIDNMFHDENGKLHALLIVGEGRSDGVLVNSSGYNYARYSALVPHVDDIITMNKYPAIAELTQKLTTATDYILAQAQGADGATAIPLQDLSERFGIDFEKEHTLKVALLSTLENDPSVREFVMNRKELAIIPSAVIDKIERGGMEKPSVLAQIKDSRSAVQTEATPTKKDNRGPEL